MADLERYLRAEEVVRLHPTMPTFVWSVEVPSSHLQLIKENQPLNNFTVHHLNTKIVWHCLLHDTLTRGSRLRTSTTGNWVQPQVDS